MDQQPQTALRLCVLGLGSVGRVLGEELALSGCRVTGWSPNLAAKRERDPRLAEVLELEPELEKALQGAEIVLMCVRDSVIRELAERCVPMITDGGPPVFLHTSGFVGVAPLGPLEAAGVATGVLHPLTAVPRREDQRTEVGRLEQTMLMGGVWFATAGDSRARRAARELIHLLRGRELALQGTPDSTEIYHAAAALLSNGMVALLDTALELAQRAVRDPDCARAAFTTLLKSTCSNLARTRPAGALTGPVARGDLEVVRGHVRCLDRLDQRGDSADAAQLYRMLSRRLVLLAAQAGRLDEDERRALNETLEE